MSNKTLNELRSEREQSIRENDWMLYIKLTSEIINKIHEEDVIKAKNKTNECGFL